MLSDELLERIFADEDMQKIPVGCQSTVVRVVDRAINELMEEKNYVYATELLS